MNELEKIVRDAIGPVARPELERDLWPAMRERMDRGASRGSLFDWLLGGAAAAWTFAFPGVIPALAYYF